MNFDAILAQAQRSDVSDWVEETLRRAVAWARLAARASPSHLNAEALLITTLLQNPYLPASLYPCVLDLVDSQGAAGLALLDSAVQARATVQTSLAVLRATDDGAFGRTLGGPALAAQLCRQYAAAGPGARAALTEALAVIMERDEGPELIMAAMAALPAAQPSDVAAHAQHVVESFLLARPAVLQLVPRASLLAACAASTSLATAAIAQYLALVDALQCGASPLVTDAWDTIATLVRRACPTRAEQTVLNAVPWVSHIHATAHHASSPRLCEKVRAELNEHLSKS